MNKKLEITLKALAHKRIQLNPSVDTFRSFNNESNEYMMRAKLNASIKALVKNICPLNLSVSTFGVNSAYVSFHISAYDLWSLNGGNID